LIDLSHVNAWVFDMDDTLYPREQGLMSLVQARINAYVVEAVGLAPQEARLLQRQFLDEHGTTLAGLMTYHGMDPAQFLEEVHDVSMENLVPDQALHDAIAALPGRRLVFTNGSLGHAERVLGHLGLRDLFGDVFAIETADYIPKPSLATFDKITKLHAIDPPTTAFFEDSEKNLVPAARLGMTTILVGAHAAASTSEHVHHRTNDLAGFLSSARLKGTS